MLISEALPPDVMGGRASKRSHSQAEPGNEAGQDFEFNKANMHMIVNVSSA
ncbi:MAG: hypothetical protein DSM106950_32980 [Stigonema ocellatum SAG 48.90 = DSM 106950]|nr:hypothetical protein [Stigonema ocellatum SAG 48.90 = DSM 106950]